MAAVRDSSAAGDSSLRADVIETDAVMVSAIAVSRIAVSGIDVSGTAVSGIDVSGTAVSGTAVSGTAVSGTAVSAIAVSAVTSDAIRASAFAVPTGAVRASAIRTGAIRTGAIRTGTVKAGIVQAGTVPRGIAHRSDIRIGCIGAGIVMADAVRSDVVGADQRIEGEPQFGDERGERGEGRVALARLDLGKQARGDAGASTEFAQTQSTTDPRAADVLPSLRVHRHRALPAPDGGTGLRDTRACQGKVGSPAYGFRSDGTRAPHDIAGVDHNRQPPRRSEAHHKCLSP